jgi:threonine aldolase
MINKAKRIRKFLGGGMRQVGVLAAAGLYALDHHIERLTDDHNRAAELAAYLSAMDGLAIETATNMIFISSQSSQPIDAHHLAKVLADHGVLITPGDASTRLVMHLEVDDHAMETIKAAFQDWYESQSGN